MKEQGHTENRSRLREGRNVSDPGDGGRVTKDRRVALRYSTPRLFVYPREPNATIRKSSQTAAGDYGSVAPANRATAKSQRARAATHLSARAARRVSGGDEL
jgi:hypothetical protein